MPTPQTILKPFTEQALREWVERDERRKDLEREARQLDAENKLVAADLLAVLKAAGQAKITRGEFTAEQDKAKGSVSWKDAFIRAQGADAAIKLAAAAPEKDVVKIHRIASAD